MNILTIMDYDFHKNQINELKMCLLWVKQAKQWLKPNDNVFVYTTKKLPERLTKEFPANFKQCIATGSHNLEPSAPKEYTEMIWYKLYILCHFPYKALFLDADAIIVNDISELDGIDLNLDNPIFMIDHEKDIEGHTDDKPPTINSGSLLINNLSQTLFCWEKLMAFGKKIGFSYRYKNSKEYIPGNDQALLQSYSEFLNYEYHHKIFDIKYNTCSKKAAYKRQDEFKRIKLRSIDNLKQDIAINHYWGPFKPWRIDCPLFKEIEI